MNIPEEFVIQKFYQFANKPQYNRLTRTYQGGCPICKEGASWGVKRRLFYVTRKNIIFCHNCGWSGKPLKWVMQVSGDSYADVCKEMETFDTVKLPETEIKVSKTSSVLPDDSIDLTNPVLLEYYKNNKIVTGIVDYLNSRRLLTAINKPLKYYTSLVDKIHKNRLVLPFYDNGKIIHYQSRGIYVDPVFPRPKYLSRLNSEKSLFNIDHVESSAEYIAIVEGPIDSCFLKNAVAVAGIQENSYSLFTKLQHQQLNKYPLHRKIWVLDSQWQDKAGHCKTGKLIDIGEHVFIWPESEGKLYKDLNEICINRGVDSIDPEWVLGNTHSGLKAKLLLSQIPI